MSKKPSIQELEALLNSEEDVKIQILPNGEIRQLGTATSDEVGNKKPLTMKEDLGGEYVGTRRGY
jgi:hypothetical protein